MDAFVDWLTDPDNHMRLNNPRPTSGKKPRDLYQEIADYVNSIHDTDWTHETTGEGDTDKETLREKIRAICPEYERSHAVYSSSLSKNPPSPKQSTVFSDDEVEDKDDGDNNNGISDSISEPTVEELLDRQSTVDEVESNIGEPERKRRQKKTTAIDTMVRFATATMNESTTRAKVTESSLRDIEEVRQDLRQRERKNQEMLDRRMQEFLEEKAEFKAKKEEFNAKQEKFEAIRDQLLKENAAMKRELEVRLSRINVSV
ncbi:hypothetical protein BGX26_002214 [Mortierella sp. AD094]|nr:hypothetical protein BGX26_002214 [Mortierella sp. AD094]